MKKILKFIALICVALSVFTFNAPTVLSGSTGVIVAQAAEIKINKSKITLAKGKTYKLKISGTSKTVKWTSSNKKVATVNSKGTVKAKSKGTATVTAKVGEEKLTCKITVKNSNKKPTKTKSNTVYWVASGSVYHSTDTCRTLSKSKSIERGKNPPADRRACKVCC